jgi:hypothetical protein
MNKELSYNVVTDKLHKSMSAYEVYDRIINPINYDISYNNCLSKEKIVLYTQSELKHLMKLFINKLINNPTNMLLHREIVEYLLSNIDNINELRYLNNEFMNKF